MSFRRRTFPEVLDNLLTSLIGGVGAEPHPFPPPDAKSPPYAFNLQQRATDVVSVYGSLDGEPHLFRKDSDYRLKDETTLEWLKEGQPADAGSLIHINYTLKSAQPVLTDIYTGSVARTLSETVALEIARLYAELEAVYRSGFIDTATGTALDKVVALLGVERVRGGRAIGTLEFSRAPGSQGSITIPASTRVITEDGEIEYETTETVMMVDGQNTIRVQARDLEQNDPLPVGALKVIPIPISGIAAVTNPAPTLIATQDQTDAELRTQAKSFLHGSERATLGAIRQAIARQGVQAEIREIQPETGCRYVEVSPHAELTPELEQRLRKAIDEVRPAGLTVSLGAGTLPRPLNLSLRLTSSPDLLPQQLRAAQSAVKAKVTDYFKRLPPDQNPSLNRLVSLALSVPEFQDVKLERAAWAQDDQPVEQVNGELQVGGAPVILSELALIDPNLPTRLTVLVTYPAGKPADSGVIQAALNASLRYLNETSAARQSARSLSYGLCLVMTPLPDKPHTTLEEYDQTGKPETLPDETTIGDFKVQFVFTQQSGLARTLSKANDRYDLAPLERLSLESVEATQQA